MSGQRGTDKLGQVERELLLWCIRPQSAADKDGVPEALLKPGVDWASLLQAARRHGVLPLVWRRLQPFECVPGTVQQTLRKEGHCLGLCMQLFTEELLALLGQLEARGVAALAFKGPALAAYTRGGPALRHPGDLDLLIHHHDYVTTRAVLLERGYRSRVRSDRERGYLKRRGACTFLSPQYAVDLHWTLAQKAFDSFPGAWSFDTDRIFERSVLVPVEGIPIPTLSPEDALCYLCVHGAKDGWPRLSMVGDVAAVIDRSPGLDWAWVLEQARSQQRMRILALGLLLAAELLKVRLPDLVARVVRKDPVVYELFRQVERRLFEAERPVDRLAHHLFKAQMLPRVREKAAYLLGRGLRSCSKSRLVTLWRGPLYASE